MPALWYISILSDLFYIDIYMDVYMKYPFALSGRFSDCFSFQGQDSYLFYLSSCSWSNTTGDSV